MDTNPRADKVMEFTLRHVPFDGWSLAALKRGARDAGVSEDEVAEMFGSDPISLIEYYSHMVDRQMIEKLQAMDLKSMKIREKIAAGVMTRLQIMGPYREAVQKAAVILSLPSNAVRGSKLMYATVDAIWRCAGDTSTDFNFYTKRGLLGLVYSSTLLYWFRDMSVEFSSTRSFLDRRLENVMSIPKIKGQVKSAVEFVTGPLKGFLRGRNKQ